MTVLTEAEELDLLGRFPDVAMPAVLLPVRVETRFSTDPANPELRVRIYPDELHVDTHEPELTDEEAAWGRHFWGQTWRAGTGTDEASVSRRHQVWEQLAQRLGAERATWVVQALAPTNPGDRPAAPVPQDEALPAAIAHPPFGSRAESWTRAPIARLLPERWIVLGYRGGTRVMLRAGKPVRPDLHAGPDPAAPAPGAVPDDQLVVDDGMRWLVDFAEAEECGMAVRVPLTVDDSALGFDTLVVFGLRTAADPGEEAKAVEALVAAHRYTEGIGVAAVGLATNNSDAGPSAHSARVLDPASTYPLQTAASPDGAAGHALATALGVDPTVLAPLDGSAQQPEADARAMQTLLWPATGGYFLDQLFAVLPEAPDARQHTLDHVRPDGPLPPLRIGRQPYGVLPATSLDRWPVLPPDSGPLGIPRPNVVIPLLKGLRDQWRGVTARVPRIDRRPGGTAPTEAAILAVLRAGPSAAAYDVRLAFDHEMFGVTGLHSFPQVPPPAAQRRSTMAGLLRGLGILGEPRLARTVMATTSSDLRASGVLAPDDAPQGDAELLAWLRDTPPADIRAETGLAAPPGHLLYLLARHAVLMTYATVAAEIQRAEDAPAVGDPAIVDVTDAPTPTLGRSLDQPLPGISRPLHELTAADHPAAAALDDMRAALDHLGTIAPARLAELLTGTLDVFAYRLDAWITSLATRRLTELRGDAPRGAIVGGYGWLEDVRPRPPFPTASDVPDEPGPLAVDPVSAGFVHAPSMPHAATAAVLRSGYVASAPTTGEQPARSPFAVDLSSSRVRLAEWLLDGIRQGQELGALLGQRFERGLHDHALDRYIAPFRRVAPFGELAAAQAAAADAAARVAELSGQPHPDAAAKAAALAAARQQHANLVQERNSLPGRLDNARSRVAAQRERHAALIANLQRIQNRLRRFPNDELANEQLVDVTMELDLVNEQLPGARNEVTGLEQRQSVIDGLVEAAIAALDSAQRDFDAVKDLPHPELAAAIEQEAAARAELERLLDEHRRRRLYPPTASIESLEAIEAQHVVDGLALARLHERGQVPFGTKGLPAAGTADHPALVAELDGLAAALDAVADALTAESVHQLVQGNPARAGASLDAVAQRTVAPPELEIARTPRTGVAITHRVLALTGATTVRWAADARQVRAAAEPALHAWAGNLLGDPRQLRVDVRYVDTGGAVVARRDLRMHNAGLGPLDLLAMVDETGRPRPELTAFLADRALATKPAGVPAGVDVELALDRQPGWPGGVRGLAEVLEVARAINELLAGARPLSPRDLAMAGSAGTAVVDVAELRARADAVLRRVGTIHRALGRALAGGTPAALRSAVVQTLFIGVPDAVPALSVGDTELDELRTRATGIAADVARRLDAARQLAADFDADAASDDDRRDHEVARIRALLGGGFVVLPRVVGVDGDVAASFADGAARFGGDRAAPGTWLHRVAPARRSVERLQTVMLYGAASPGALGVAQLPFTAGERWVALPATAGGAVPSGRTSIVAHGAADLGQPVAGLFVDEWVELVPNATEITGLACNVDEPAAHPPQCVLIAVAPPQSPRWGVDLLESIVLETLDLARIRAVSPEQLASFTELEQVLPALYFGLNLRDDTVSTDFSRAMEG